LANQATITINDGAATPVAHSFTPVNVNSDGVAKYSDKSLGIAIGYPIVTLQPKESNKQSRSNKVLGKVALPVLEQVAGSTNTGFTPAPVVAYTLYFNFDFALPDRCTLQNRKDILAYAKNLLGNALVSSLVQDGEYIS
jgi:hypothetical protein